MANPSNGHVVEIKLDKDRIKTMETSEKLNVLVDIAFANHTSIRRMNSILIGDENHEGFCGMVKATRKSIRFLWGVFCSVAGAIFTALLYILTKG